MGNFFKKNPLNMPSTKLKVHELKPQKKEELQKQLDELKQELVGLRVAKVTGGAASKLTRIRKVRKDIARLYIVMNTVTKENLRKLYARRKHKPLDLRPKLTRALRRQLTPHDKNLKSRKALRRLRTYPTRKFALKA